MRSWRSEVLTVSMVMTVPLGIALAFPYRAACFVARTDRVDSDTAFAAFVKLSGEDEAKALSFAKFSWQNENAASRGKPVDLFVGDLPEDDSASPVLGIDSRPHGERPAVQESVMPPFRPSRAMGEQKKLPVGERVAEEPFFSKDELLRLD